MDVKPLHSFPSMFLPGGSLEDTNGASSLSFFILFLLRWTKFKPSMLVTFLSLFQMLSHADATRNHSALAIHLFRSVEHISEDSCFPFSIRSSYFEVVIPFKPFNSTGAISLLNCSTVFLLSGP